MSDYIKRKKIIKEQLREEIKNLKCVKCETTENLVPYDHNYTRSVSYGKRSTTYKIQTTILPLCRNCQYKFKQWYQYRNKTQAPNICASLFCIISFSLILFSIWAKWDASYLIFGIVLGIIALPFIGLSINIITKAKQMEFDPRKYIKNKSRGRVYIKTQSSDKWILYQEWIYLVLAERKEEILMKLIKEKEENFNKKENLENHN